MKLIPVGVFLAKRVPAPLWQSLGSLVTVLRALMLTILLPAEGHCLVTLSRDYLLVLNLGCLACFHICPYYCHFQDSVYKLLKRESACHGCDREKADSGEAGQWVDLQEVGDSLTVEPYVHPG